MEMEALVKNEKGIKEGKGLSYLDVLKHAVKTIIETLGESDRFGLVSFSDIAQVLLLSFFLSLSLGGRRRGGRLTKMKIYYFTILGPF